ncbi:hypothetical protein NRB20_70390 [Nocardia sp. RB20]|uniref:S-adenosyl methyltransferase n=2 Tax=Nocardia macrotermitis TaxID=2585198 RepID=A0A7K0DDM3_9NOCA|nr:hypothetical protein [Nocardia macrotermitis]
MGISDGDDPAGLVCLYGPRLTAARQTQGEESGMSLEDNEFDTRQAHSARMYDYYLGGKDNYPADREAASQVMNIFPEVGQAARANREFMLRAVTAAAESGIDQFLDVGTGIPTTPNLHHAAQAVNRAARVVYADNDPLVLTHARALMTGSDEGRTAFVLADVHEAQQIFGSAEFADIIDLSRPVAVSLVALLHFVVENPAGVVKQLMDAVPSGSWLIVSHGAADLDPERFAELKRIYDSSGVPIMWRTRDEVTALFEGFDLLEPGVVPPHRWRPSDRFFLREEVLAEMDRVYGQYAAVAIKP